jgi:hypothetical protein
VGATSKPSYYSVQEKVEHAIASIMGQNIGQCFVYAKQKRKAEMPWFGTVTLPKDLPDADEAAFRREAASYHAKPLKVIDEEGKARIARFYRAEQAELYMGPPERTSRGRKR